MSTILWHYTMTQKDSYGRYDPNLACIWYKEQFGHEPTIVLTNPNDHITELNMPDTVFLDTRPNIKLGHCLVGRGIE